MSTPTPSEMPDPSLGQTKKKPWYRKWWIWVIIVAFLGVISIATGDESDDTTAESTQQETTTEVAAAPFDSCQKVTDGNGVGCETVPEAEPAEEVDPVEVAAPVEVEEEPRSQAPAPETTGQEVPRESRNALRQAQRYVDMMAFSYQGLYDQLTSDYGGQFPAEAAQYAVDNVDVDWNEEALESARNYQETIGMSDSALYDQLISEYGGQFTPDEAQYAINNY